jgi:hypothetical protein
MKTRHPIITTTTFFLFAFLLSACSSPKVGDARQSGVDRRQDRIDARTSARQDRWEERGDREDARAAARFDAM